MMRTSFLTLGGWSEDDYNGEITWFDLPKDSHGWNQTVSGFTFGDTDIFGGD